MPALTQAGPGFMPVLLAWIAGDICGHPPPSGSFAIIAFSFQSCSGLCPFGGIQHVRVSAVRQTFSGVWCHDDILVLVILMVLAPVISANTGDPHTG